MNTKSISIIVYSSHSPEAVQIKDRLDPFFHTQLVSTPQGLETLSRQIEPEIIIVMIQKSGDSIYTHALEASRKVNSGLFVLAPSYNMKDELHYLQTGADQYLLIGTPDEALKLRLMRLARRIQSQKELISLPLSKLSSSANNEDTLIYENFRVDRNQELVYCEDQLLTLPNLHVKLFIAFLTLPDELITREWLKTHIWKGADISPRSIDAHISKLKKAIPSLQKDLVNIYGKGYLFKSSQQLAS